MTCTCQTIGAPNEIRFCSDDHAYWLSDKRLTSVSAVIKAIFPTDYSMVDPAVLENARIRGERVDKHFTTYVTTGNVTIEPGERSDVVDRLSRLIDFWDKNGYNVTSAQKIVHDDTIAGTLDLEISDEYIMDLKCVSALQPAYKLQVGAYLSLGGYDRAAIIHVMKGKVKLVPYDAEECRGIWKRGVEWYKTMKALNGGFHEQA
jgi:hypothetical protein